MKKKRFLISVIFVILLSSLFFGCSNNKYSNDFNNGINVITPTPTPTLAPNEIRVTVTPRPTSLNTPTCIPDEEPHQLSDEYMLSLILTQSSYTVNECDFATIAIADNSLTEKGCSVEFSYTGELSATTGQWFVLEVLINDKWYGMPLIVDDYGINSIGYTIVKDNNTIVDYNWSYPYGSLRPNHYRIVCVVSEDTEQKPDNFYLAAEFDVE